jgi:hypothetical protein
MRTLMCLFAVATLTACSESATTAVPLDSTAATQSIVTTDGPLELTVTDAPAQPGFLFITGTVTGGQAMVTVSSTRYGSLCSTAITAHADVASHTITLSVKYSERLTSCVAEVRAITYRADINGLAAGAYDVNVVHTNADGATSTVITQRVNVT